MVVTIRSIYLKDDFSEKVLEITKNKGVDVIYDSVGKDTFLKGIHCLAPKGRIVSFGVSSGPIEPIDINSLRAFSGSIANWWTKHLHQELVKKCKTMQIYFLIK